MPVKLGAEFRPRTPAVIEPPRESEEARRLAAIELLLADLARLLADRPAPPPSPPAPDLTPIAERIDALAAVRQPLGPTAAEIAEAIATTVRPPEPDTALAATLEAIRAMLEALEWRSRSPVQAFGGGAVNLNPNDRSLLEDIKRHVNDMEVRLDFTGRLDSNPVYVGRAVQGTATTADWAIQKLDYDANSRLIRVQVQEGAWDDRTTLF